MAAKICLEAGKAVLCEKPLTMNLVQARELFALAQEKKLLLMEAIWMRFLPAWREAKRRIDAGEIGRVLTVQTSLDIYCGFDEQSRLYNMEKGGGALLDLGVYALHAAMYILGNGYCGIQAVGRLSPTGSDAYTAVTLTYPDGAVAVTTCGMDCRGGEKVARILGENGSVTLPNIVSPDHYILRVDGKAEEVVRLPFEQGFLFEVEEFVSLLRTEKTRSEIAPPEATLAVMGAIDESLKKLSIQH